MLVAHNESFYRAWGLSMFYSIHCLTMLHMSSQNYFSLSAGGANMSHRGHGGHSLRKRGFVDLSKIDERQHVEHCMGYIGHLSRRTFDCVLLLTAFLQVFLCNGDDTLEPSIGELDENGNVIWSGVSGEGVQHTCRDSSHA
ncbi:hypothetical protein HD806DRAFT_479896 [Xylariaceae sp. AK1471]|nr:hypothetical protein HD806DRAFT_479896 [Xylariaceae sp. AK1471]